MVAGKRRKKASKEGSPAKGRCQMGEGDSSPVERDPREQQQFYMLRSAVEDVKTNLQQNEENRAEGTEGQVQILKNLQSANDGLVENASATFKSSAVKVTEAGNANDLEQQKRTQNTILVTEKKCLKLFFSENDGYGISRFFADRDEQPQMGRHELALRRRMMKKRRESRNVQSITSNKLVGYFGDKPLDAILLAIEGKREKTKSERTSDSPNSKRNCGQVKQRMNGKGKLTTEESDEKKESGTATAQSRETQLNTGDRGDAISAQKTENHPPLANSKYGGSAGGAASIETDESLADDADFLPVAAKSRKNYTKNNELGSFRSGRVGAMRYRKSAVQQSFGARASKVSRAALPQYASPNVRTSSRITDSGSRQGDSAKKEEGQSATLSECAKGNGVHMLAFRRDSPANCTRDYAAAVARNVGDTRQSTASASTISVSLQPFSPSDGMSSADADQRACCSPAPLSPDLEASESTKISENGESDDEDCSHTEVPCTDAAPHGSVSEPVGDHFADTDVDCNCNLDEPSQICVPKEASVNEEERRGSSLYADEECVTFVGRLADVDDGYARRLRDFCFFFDEPNCCSSPAICERPSEPECGSAATEADSLADEDAHRAQSLTDEETHSEKMLPSADEDTSVSSPLKAQQKDVDTENREADTVLSSDVANEIRNVEAEEITEDEKGASSQATLAAQSTDVKGMPDLDDSVTLDKHNSSFKIFRDSPEVPKQAKKAPVLYADVAKLFASRQRHP